MSSNKRYNCPFCPGLGLRNDDFAFSVSWEKGKYHCFRCGTSGGVVSLPPNFKKPLILEKDKKPQEQLSMEAMLSLGESPRAKNYLRGRKLDPQPLESFVFVSGNKLVFPIFGSRGDIVYYVARKMWGSGRRYDNMAAAIPDIYIPPGVILPARWILIITEGVFDALSVWQWLGMNAIALLGMEINPFKVRKILQYTYSDTAIVILLDAGEYRAAQAYYDELRPLRKNVMICKLDEGDPNEVGEEILWKKLTPLVTFVEEKTSSSTD